MPKKGIIKYKKYHKKCIREILAIRIPCCPDSPISEIVSKEPFRVSLRHLGSIKRTVRRSVKKQGRLHRQALPFWPVTSKPMQIRMGKGKGAVSYWIGKSTSGSQVAAFEKIKKDTAHKILLVAATKLPVRSYVFTYDLERWGHNFII